MFKSSCARGLHYTLLSSARFDKNVTINLKSDLFLLRMMFFYYYYRKWYFLQELSQKSTKIINGTFINL